MPIYNEKSSFNNSQRYIAVDFSNSVDYEVTTSELLEKWQKTKRIVVTKMDYDDHKKTYTRMRIKK